MTAKTKNKQSNQRMMLIVGVAAVIAVIVAATFVLLSSRSSPSGIEVNYDEIPQARLEDGGFVLGAADAVITVVAFEDFLCPHCQRYKATADRFISEYVTTGQARFEYRFFPAVDTTYSPLTARLAECANTLRPGTFWQAHNVLFELASASYFNDRAARSFAEQMEMTYTDLLECTQDARQVDIDVQLGTQLGITGTPTIFIRYSGSVPQPSPFGQQPTFEQLATLVDASG